MTLLSIGISHKHAPIELREKIAFSDATLPQAIASFEAAMGTNSVVILSTCNRTEVYCELETEQISALTTWLATYHDVPIKELEEYLYHHIDYGAIRHLYRVAAGLDSLVLGEPQILGQLKQAYQLATKDHPLCTPLERLFQTAFSVAKTIRTSTDLGKNPVSVAYAAVTLAKQIFGNLSKRSVLLIGAGETIELALRHLYHNGIGSIVIANRSIENAEKLAAPFQADVARIDDIPEHLINADIVISATAANNYIIASETFNTVYKKRRGRVLYMVDLAIPRDIDPEIDKNDDVYLYSVDDLQDVIEENIRARKKAAEQAEDIIDHDADQFVGWLRQQSVTSVIKSYREHAESLRDEVLAKSLSMIEASKTPEEALKFLATTLSNKLCHLPSSTLRDAGRDGNNEIINAFASALESLEKEKKNRESND